MVGGRPLFDTAFSNKHDHQSYSDALFGILGYASYRSKEGDALTECNLAFRDVKYTSDYDNPLLRPSNTPSRKSLEMEGGKLMVTHSRLVREDIMLGGGVHYDVFGGLLPVFFARRDNSAGTVMSTRIVGTSASASVVYPATEALSLAALARARYPSSVEEVWIGATWKQKEFEASASIDAKNLQRLTMGLQVGNWKLLTMGLGEGIFVSWRR